MRIAAVNRSHVLGVLRQIADSHDTRVHPASLQQLLRQAQWGKETDGIAAIELLQLAILEARTEGRDVVTPDDVLAARGPEQWPGGRADDHADHQHKE